MTNDEKKSPGMCDLMCVRVMMGHQSCVYGSTTILLAP